MQQKLETCTANMTFLSLWRVCYSRSAMLAPPPLLNSTTVAQSLNKMSIIIGHVVDMLHACLKSNHGFIS